MLTKEELRTKGSGSSDSDKDFWASEILDKEPLNKLQNTKFKKDFFFETVGLYAYEESESKLK